MAYFQDKGLVFIHVPKNAGKSVEIALNLVTGKSLSDAGRRSKINRALTYLQRETRSDEVRSVLHGTLDLSLCAQHLTVQEIQLLNLLPEGKLSDYKTFAVCRNPWDRALSSFRHFTSSQGSSPADFERFCENWYSMKTLDHNVMAHQRTQMDFIVDTRGKVAVERILRFEHLADDFSTMSKEWKLDAPELPHIGKQGEKMAYQDGYTDRAKEIIDHLFAEDIEYLDYTF